MSHYTMQHGILRGCNQFWKFRAELTLTLCLLVYTPPSAATEGCNVYDVANGETRHVMQGAYDSVGGIAGV